MVCYGIDMTLDMTTPMTTPMSTQLSTLVQGDRPLPEHLAGRVSQLIQSSKAENTLRAYASDLACFTRWCDSKGRQVLPASPETVAAYVADHAGVWKVSTLCRRVAAISEAHKLAELVNPCAHVVVTETLSGLRRQNTRNREQAAGLLAGDLMKILQAITGTELADYRDKALLLVGWCAALRRSELAGLTWGQVERDPDGVRLHLMNTKTDKGGEGQTVGLSYDETERCPVRALLEYKERLGRLDRALVADHAHVFTQLSRWGKPKGNLAGQGVATILQRRAAAAGLVGHYSGHSLRVGLIQQAKLAGVEDSVVMATTRHKGVSMLKQYQGTAGLVSRAAHKGLLA